MIIDPKKVIFKAVRAHGPGGQNANRRSTRVQLWVRIGDLPITEQQKKVLREKLWHHVNREDEIWIADEEERLQSRNKDKALAHLNLMIEGALRVPLPRIPTEKPRNAEDARIREKKIISAKKKSRRIKEVV